MRDVKSDKLEAETGPQTYLPLTQWAHSGTMSIVVQVEGDPLALVSAVRAETKALDPYLPLANVRTLAQVRTAATSARRLWLFAGTALLLTVVGLYGVIAYLVGRRVREIGIRLALGAGQAAILRLILTQGMRPVIVGVAIGLLAALALTRWMQSLLFGVSATDPLTFILIPLLLASGQHVAGMASGFRMRVLYYDPFTCNSLRFALQLGLEEGRAGRIPGPGAGVLQFRLDSQFVAELLEFDAVHDVMNLPAPRFLFISGYRIARRHGVGHEDRRVVLADE